MSIAHLSRRLRTNVTWVFLLRASCMLAVFANYAYLARLLPTQAFATYVLLASLAVFGSRLAMFGLNTLVCRYLSASMAVGDRASARHAARIVLRMGLTSVPLVGFATWLLAETLLPSAFSTTPTAPHAEALALWVMLLAVSQILAEAFRGLHRIRTASLLSGVSGGAVANLGLLLTLFVYQHVAPINLAVVLLFTVGTLFAPLGIAAMYLCFSRPLSLCQAPKRTSARPVCPSAWTALQAAAPLTLFQLLSYGIAQVDIWVVGAYCPSHDLAVYGACRKLSLLVAVPLTQMGMAVASTIAELDACRETEQLRRVLKAAATIAALATALPWLALAGFPGITLTLTFGADYATGATSLRILLLGQLVYACTGLCGTTLLMTGRPHVLLGALLASLPMAALTPGAAVHYGLPGIACVFAAMVATQNLLQCHLVQRTLHLQTIPDLTPSYIASLLRAWRNPSRAPSSLDVQSSAHVMAGRPLAAHPRCGKLQLPH